MLSAFGLRSSSSSSSAKAAQAKLVQEIQERERSRNAMRIRDAAGLVREQGRKLVQRIKRKISSKSPEEDKPKTWEEYVAKYAKVSFPRRARRRRCWE